MILRAWLALSIVVALATGATAETVTVNPIGSELALPATILKPDGTGPFPAIVILHDCSGLGPRSSGAPRRWADELVPQGYVVMLPDSFTPRGFDRGVCLATISGRERANNYVRAADAYGALAALRRLPYVDPTRIGVMGGSHGGSTTLAALAAPVRDDDPLAESKAHGFAAAIALYPRCDAHYGAWSILRQGGARGPMSAHFGTYRPVSPLLILSGALDDWTPAEPCRQLVDVSRAAGHDIAIVVYPGAHHAFDSAYPVRFIAERGNPNSPTGRGATTGGNAEAWADAKKQVARFFGERLKAR